MAIEEKKFRKCCIITHYDFKVDSEEDNPVIDVYSNLKVAIEFINKKNKLKGKDKISYSRSYRQLRMDSQIHFIRNSKRIRIYQRRINTKLNQPHKQLKIK